MRWFAAVLLGAAACAACSGGSATEQTSDEDAFIVEAEPTSETFDPTDPEQLSGVSTSPSNIDAGDCFNEYVYRDRADFLQQITTIVGCDSPHDREAYFVTEYPADNDDAAPPEETLIRWAQGACLDEFESFIGLEYVLSALEIGAIVPTFETWTNAGDRNVICYVYPDDTGQRLRISVANSGL